MGQDPQTYSQTQAAQNQQLMQQRHQLAHNLELGPERLGLEFLLDGTQRINKISNGMNSAHEATSFVAAGRASDLGNPLRRRRNSIGVGGYTTGSSGQEIVAHAAPIRNGPPTCPLDSLLLDLLHERQQQAADGVGKRTPFLQNAVTGPKTGLQSLIWTP